MNFQKIMSAVITLTSVIGSVFLIADQIVIGIALWSAGYLAVLWRQLTVFQDLKWRRFPSTQLMTRICFLFGVAGPLFHLARPNPELGWTALVLSLLLLRLSRTIPEIASRVSFEVEHLPGVSVASYPKKRARAATISVLFLPPILMLLAMLKVSGLYLLLVSVAIAFVVASGMLQSYIWRKSRLQLSDAIPEKLAEFEPKFAIYWNAPGSSKFHLTMWVPFLQRTGFKFVIIVRNRGTFNDAVEASGGVPVIWARTLSDVDQLIVDSLSTVFYANNSDKNSHMVRHLHLKHVQLLHGDSEKTPSFNPVTAMYDRVYVAGQAAIDRYEEHKVQIDNRKFSIVGRPQVEGVVRDDSPISDKTDLTVLYAPTWNGYFQDTAYSSVPIIMPLVTYLLEQGIRIIFRPHPYSNKNPELATKIKEIHELLAVHKERTGIEHVWGEEAEREMSVNDCFNASDLMLADVSSVITDYLYSGKPLGIMTGEASPEEVIGTWKLAKGAYVFGNDTSRWEQQFDVLISNDPLRAERQKMRSYYLGDIPFENYAETFVETARADIETGK